MCCSYKVLTNPHMKPRIQFIIMKIFMKIVKICPKSPQFTVDVKDGLFGTLLFIQFQWWVQNVIAVLPIVRVHVCEVQ